MERAPAQSKTHHFSDVNGIDFLQVQAGGREFEPHHGCYMLLLAQMDRALEVVIYVTQTAIFLFRW